MRIERWEKIDEERYFSCRGFGYIACYYRNKRRKEKRIRQGESEQPSSNRFGILTNQVIRMGIQNARKPKKNKKTILRGAKEDEILKKARKKSKEIRDVRRTNRLPKKVWMKIKLEKLDIYESVFKGIYYFIKI